MKNLISFTQLQVNSDVRESIFAPGATGYYLPCIHPPMLHRPTTLACFVQSLDGKFSHPQQPQGPVIARINLRSDQGSKADWWILQLIRSHVDAVVIGSHTLQLENPKEVLAISDSVWQQWREIKHQEGRFQYDRPFGVILTMDGRDLPLHHPEVHQPRNLICTSPQGADYLTTQLNNIGDRLLVTGDGAVTDSIKILTELKKRGVNYLSVESPSFFWQMVANRSLDELWLNTSAILTGGQFAFGTDHLLSISPPTYAKLISLHLTDPYFLFSRWQLDGR